MSRPRVMNTKKIDDGPESMRTGRLSGIKTSSEVARERALTKAGLDLAWYADKVADLTDSNGDACCEACGQPETKKRPGGAVKDLVVDTKAKRLVCASCADRNYKNQQRLNVSRRTSQDGAE